jgi:hypothetical protein
LSLRELSSVNTLHEHKLCSRSQTREHTSVSAYRVYSVSTDNIFMGYEKFSIPRVYKGGGTRLTDYLCHSWEKTLKVRLGASFYNMEDWKGIKEKSGEISITKAHNKLCDFLMNSHSILH